MVAPEAGKLNPRADSFSLYMNHVANAMLTSLLPKGKLEHNVHKTVQAGHEQDHLQANRAGIKQAVANLTNIVKNKAHRS